MPEIPWPEKNTNGSWVYKSFHAHGTSIRTASQTTITPQHQYTYTVISLNGYAWVSMDDVLPGTDAQRGTAHERSIIPGAYIIKNDRNAPCSWKDCGVPFGKWEYDGSRYCNSHIFQAVAMDDVIEDLDDMHNDLNLEDYRSEPELHVIQERIWDES